VWTTAARRARDSGAGGGLGGRVSSALVAGASLHQGQVLAPAGGWRRWLFLPMAAAASAGGGRRLLVSAGAWPRDPWLAMVSTSSPTPSVLLLRLLCRGITLEVGSGAGCCSFWCRGGAWDAHGLPWWWWCRGGGVQAATMCTSGRQTWCNRAKAFTGVDEHDGGVFRASISLLGASLRGAMFLKCGTLG
jgi:hypothetical protein